MQSTMLTSRTAPLGTGQLGPRGLRAQGAAQPIAVLRQCRTQEAQLFAPAQHLGRLALPARSSVQTHVGGIFKLGSKEEPLSPDDPDQIALRASAPTKRSFAFIAFWAQLGLAIVSSGVLLFSVAFTPRTPGPAELSKYLTLGGVVCSWLSTFFAHGFLRLARKLADGGVVARPWLQASLMRNSSLNLLGIAVTVIGLQASVGTLVAKTLVTAVQAPYQYGPGAGGANTLVSLDVFALQAATNCLLAHVVSLFFVNAMLRLVQGAVPKPVPSSTTKIDEGVPEVRRASTAYAPAPPSREPLLPPAPVPDYGAPSAPPYPAPPAYPAPPPPPPQQQQQQQYPEDKGPGAKPIVF